ncbi:MAG: hypothetical protein RIB43_15795 [Rhodospirillaceae bacterium]
MPNENLSQAEQKLLEDIATRYEESLVNVRKITKSLPDLVEETPLTKLVHSLRVRTKEPSHLLDKLMRKMIKSKKENTPFSITPDNLFEKVNDLAGMRLLHLHTDQFPEINQLLKDHLEENGYPLLEGPIASTWDDEYKKFFEDHGIETKRSPNFYTSVHYVVGINKRSKYTAEIQVRTLAEELWGEVDHSFNYPHPCGIPACAEQIKVLARVTSSSTRLVDSIFRTRTSLTPQE